MFFPNFLSKWSRCVFRRGGTVLSVGLPPSSGSVVIRLAGTAELLRCYLLPKTISVFDVAPQNNNAFPPVASQSVNYKDDYRPLHPNCYSRLEDPDVNQFLMAKKGPFEKNKHCSLLKSSIIFVFLWCRVFKHRCCQSKSCALWLFFVCVDP